MLKTCQHMLLAISAPTCWETEYAAVSPSPLPPSLPAPPPPFLLTLKSFSWNSDMSERCYVSHYTSVKLQLKPDLDVNVALHHLFLHHTLDSLFLRLMIVLEIKPTNFTLYHNLTAHRYISEVTVHIVCFCHRMLAYWLTAQSPIWSAPVWSASIGRESPPQPRSTWTTVPRRSRPAPCLLVKTTTQSSLAQVRQMGRLQSLKSPFNEIHPSPVHLVLSLWLACAGSPVEIFVYADHRSISVVIKVNGTSVVSGSFIVYDCERTGEIHPTKSWVSCFIDFIRHWNKSLYPHPP